MNSLGEIFTKHSSIFPQQGQFNSVKPTNTTVLNESNTISEEQNNIGEETIITHNQTDLEIMKKTIYNIKDQLDGMLRLIEQTTIVSKTAEVNTNNNVLTNLQLKNPTDTDNNENEINSTLATGEQIIYGIFNGEKMISSDGQTYPVPTNYASKSKIVEGDRMKLTITQNGKFIYKQISPVERKQLVGTLVSKQGQDNWGVLVDGRTYRILSASVTFYKGQVGDDVYLFISNENSCSWAAVESIIRH